MKYLLDTCVISEMIRQKPSISVVEWVRNRDEDDLYISVLTIGELHNGIEKLSDTIRKRHLHGWVEKDLASRFLGRILEVDLNVAIEWGKIQGRAQRAGKSMPAIDALIAATGIVHNLIVVTRNIADMKESGASLSNPWEHITSEDS